MNKFESRYEKSKRKEKVKSEYVAKLSHDVRNSMNVILGMTAIADVNSGNQRRVSDCLYRINSAGRHLLLLINEVFDMEKMESGSLELMDEELTIHGIFDSLLEVMQPQIEEKKHKISIHDDELIHEKIIGDSLHLLQIFVKVMENAVRYTPSGGELRVTLCEKPINNPHLGCFEFIFEDNGPGMSKEMTEQVFDLYSDGWDIDDEGLENRGFGLCIASYLAQLMNGGIRIDSEEGKGTRVTVTLYLRLQADEDISFGDYVNAPVLVVDDQPEFCETTCMMLKDMDLDGEYALSGKEAVEKIRSGRNYFAIMLDWKMPEMDGLETAKAIREIVGDAIPIIILSGYDWPEIETEARKAGVNAFISKNAFKSRLIYMLKRMIKANPEEGVNPLEKLDADRFSGKRVLVAEDNEINAEIVKEILETADIKVECVENGKEALDRLTASEPGWYSMVFMDIQMPVMDGYEASRKIRSSGREDLEKLPIIAMTADAFAEHARAAEEAGMNQHIAKPLSVNQIAEVLQKWL